MSFWGKRLMPLLYDPFVWAAERGGMRELRRSLVASARGQVLEIGAGTGLNLPFYGSGVDGLVLAEPEPGMAKQLRDRLASATQPTTVVEAPAEQLPFGAGSFDCVISTLVLCTVDDRARTLAEIKRVLAPTGRLLFIEHVRAEPGSRLERWQDRLHGPWHWFAYGCDCNVRTLDVIAGAGFELDAVDAGRWNRMPQIVQPLAIGSARPG